MFSFLKQEENKKFVKIDTLIFDYLNKLDRDLHKSKVLYLAVSKLKNNNIKVVNRPILNEMLDVLSKKIGATSFNLNNEDIIFIYNSRFDEDIKAVIIRMKFMYNNDPLLKESKDLEKVGLVKVYDLATEYEAFKRVVRSTMREVELRRDEGTKSDIASVPSEVAKNVVRRELTPTMLAKLQKSLAMTDFSSLVRRQSICAVIGSSAPQALFDEVYVSIADLRDMLLPDVDLTSNHWLFQHLTETLDRRVLANVSQHDDGSLKNNFSLNLNVATILSDEFLVFDENINPSMKSSIILELQLVDIFSDVKAFILARTFAQYRGYKICIDAITSDKLKYLNREHFKVDFIKVIWTSSLMDMAREDSLFEDLSEEEKEKIIICRVDNPHPIEVGNSLGIYLYQGRYVQRMLAAAPKKTSYVVRK